MMPFDRGVNRRGLLRFFGGGALLGFCPRSALAGETRIGPLIAEARGKGPVSHRISFISAALRGTRYLGYTLIGGPRRPEQFVLRDDGFDCVTFCETVLAAAIAADKNEFAVTLRKIRYRDGIVSWRERNHYFFEWGLRNIDNGICHAVAMPGSVEIHKIVYWHRELGRRHFSMSVIPRAALFANRSMLSTGDIVGFITQRPNLDYFHVGFIVFNRRGELLLRHASQSHGRVIDEALDGFVADNRVRYVTLLRPQEPGAVALRV